MKPYFFLLRTFDVVLISWLRNTTKLDELLPKHLHILMMFTVQYYLKLKDISEIYIYGSSFYDAHGLITYDSLNNAVVVTFKRADAINDCDGHM